MSQWHYWLPTHYDLGATVNPKGRAPRGNLGGRDCLCMLARDSTLVGVIRLL